jgi:N-acetyl-1-D-myo-inositol-2-amino-2-deoxy-alpha-D-glucopyranoside deacetylase
LRVLLHGTALVAGAAAGVLGSFVHPATAWGVPVGLLCALALSAAVLVAAGLAVGSRSGAAATAAGWLLPVLLFSSPRPEGDLVVPGDALGYAWLFGGIVVAGLAVAWPYRPYVRSDVRPASSAQAGDGR